MSRPSDVNEDYWKSMESVKPQRRRRPQQISSKVQIDDNTKPEKQIKEGILLVTDEKDKPTSLTSILDQHYLITVPSCQHHVDFNYKVDASLADQRGLDYYYYERALKELPKVEQSQIKLGCKQCVDEKWLNLTLKKSFSLYLVSFQENQQTFEIKSKGITLNKPASWFDIQDEKVIIDCNHGHFQSLRQNCSKLFLDLSLETKIGYFNTVITEQKFVDLAIKIKGKIAKDYEIYSPPDLLFLTETIDEVELDDEVFLLDPTPVVEEDESPTLTTEEETTCKSFTSEGNDIGPESNAEINEGIAIRGGKDAYLQKQFLPQMYPAYITDSTLYYLCKESLQYWIPEINQAPSNTEFSFGPSSSGTINLKSGTLIRLIESGTRTSQEICTHIIYTLIEESAKLDGEILIAAYDQTILGRKL